MDGFRAVDPSHITDLSTIEEDKSSPSCTTTFPREYFTFVYVPLLPIHLFSGGLFPFTAVFSY
jgi:hypothetical protein